MTETEISKLRETVLQLWEGSKYLLLARVDLFEYVQNLKKELAEKISMVRQNHTHLKQSNKMLGLLSLRALMRKILEWPA